MSARPWPASWPAPARLVAEALRPVPNPLRTALASGPPAAPAEVARSLAASLLPEERVRGEPPPWLWPAQQRGWRRALAALHRFGGALLADPVGSGKTYVALAVAAALAGRRPAACLVPAPLVAQWRELGLRLGVAIEVSSHQQASRGRLPHGTAGLVIVDESQHFRHPGTRRYAHTAPWLVGRPVLLLSATPVVNRLADLAHQLLLGVRDDALLADGVPSLRAQLILGEGVPALGRLVIEESCAAGPRPARAPVANEAGPGERLAAERIVMALAALRLSRHPPTAALIRSVLHRAAASSPAALEGALRRYRSLLLHARDALAAGRSPGRDELRRFAGELTDQLVLWDLLDVGQDTELDLGDLELVGQVARAVAPGGADPKLERLRVVLADRTPTLVFASRRETVRHLRDGLAPPAVAWCTGDRAGLGPAPAPRAAVLSWFRDPTPGSWQPPHCLVVTDVAAEGLDLRRAARVVHYDLPWTPMRLEQREGRAVRLGSEHELVEVIRFTPPPALEEALRIDHQLARKASLPTRAGLGAGGARLWRWRSDLADRIGPGALTPGTASIRAEPVGALAGFELYGIRSTGEDRLSAAVGWLDADGAWTEEPALVAERVITAAGAPGLPDDGETTRRVLDALTPVVRARLALAASRRWTAAEPEPAARRLAAAIHAEVRVAARARDGAALTRLERALAFVGGGHTAGEAMLVRQLATFTAGKSIDAHLPEPTPRWDAIGVRLTGLLLFAGRPER